MGKVEECLLKHLASHENLALAFCKSKIKTVQNADFKSIFRTRWAQMCTCGTGNLVLHALLSCRRRRQEDLVGLCKLVAVLISLFFFSSIVTQCSCFFCLFFVGFFFNMRKWLLMAAMIFMVRSPGWCHGWSASGVCLHSSALLSKTWARLCC